jgi:hypothetical protein
MIVATFSSALLLLLENAMAARDRKASKLRPKIA